MKALDKNTIVMFAKGLCSKATSNLQVKLFGGKKVYLD